MNFPRTDILVLRVLTSNGVSVQTNFLLLYYFRYSRSYNIFKLTLLSEKNTLFFVFCLIMTLILKIIWKTGKSFRFFLNTIRLLLVILWLFIAWEMKLLEVENGLSDPRLLSRDSALYSYIHIYYIIQTIYIQCVQTTVFDGLFS